MKIFVVAAILLMQFGSNDMSYFLDYGVKIHVALGDKEGAGSGIYVANDQILTANHLWAEGARFYVDEDHKEEALVVKYDETLDLLLLKVAKKHRKISFGSVPRRLETVITTGFPMGNAHVMVLGRVADLSENHILIDSTVVRGMSGGGVFSERGRLVGMCIAAWGDKDQQFMVAVSVSAIKNFIK